MAQKSTFFDLQIWNFEKWIVYEGHIHDLAKCLLSELMEVGRRGPGRDMLASGSSEITAESRSSDGPNQ